MGTLELRVLFDCKIMFCCSLRMFAPRTVADHDYIFFVLVRKSII